MIETDTLFIDTNVFIRHRFNFDSLLFIGLIGLCEDGYANLITTDIHCLELNNKLNEEVKNIVDAHNKFSKIGKKYQKFSEELNDNNLNRLNADTLRANFHDKLYFFFEKIKVNKLLSQKISAEEVFKNYYSKKPPFGLNKKSKEFADAFILKTIKDWAENNSKKVYVVSSDPDFENYCRDNPELILFTDLKDLLKVFFEKYNPAEAYVDEIVRYSYRSIEREVSSLFPNQPFTTTDLESEVVEVTVDSVKVENHLVTAHSNEEITVLIGIEVKFNALISFEDYEFAMYDKEDDTHYGVEYEEKEIEDIKELELEVKISVNTNTHRMKSFKLLNLSGQETITI